MDAAEDGKLRALWAIGYDVYMTLANTTATANALEKLELVIVQDLFLNETAKRFGHIFLPTASVFEKDGTFMNSDRRVQRIRRAVDPIGHAKPDWWIIGEIASRLGHGHHFLHENAEAIWDEIRQVWPGGAGLSYARMEHDFPQWPCPTESHPGTPILHGEKFAHGTRTRFQTIPLVINPEQIDVEIPFRLTTGRHLYQFNAGILTQRTSNVLLQSVDLLEIAPVDATRLGLTDGDHVEVISRYGTIELPIGISNRIKAGELFTTFHDAGLFVNRITSSVRDRIADAPEYKLTAVQIRKAVPK